MPIPFQHTFTMMVCGPSRAGKTEWVRKLLLFNREMISPPPQRIYICYNEWQPLYETIKQDNDGKPSKLEFHQGIMSCEEMDATERKLIIYDDLMSSLSKNIADVFTRRSHHANLSAIWLTQNMYQQDKINRTVSLNTSYMVLFKSPRDKAQIYHLARSMYPCNSKFLVESFADATKEAFHYLVIDLRQETPEQLRLRSNVFPGEQTVVYVPK